MGGDKKILKLNLKYNDKKSNRNSTVNYWFEIFVRYCRQDSLRKIANNLEFFAASTRLLLLFLFFTNSVVNH